MRAWRRYERIRSGERPSWPERPVVLKCICTVAGHAAPSPAAKSFVEALLVHTVSERLGSAEQGGASSVKSHEWLAGWPWEQMAARQLPPPCTPPKPFARWADDSEVREHEYKGTQWESAQEWLGSDGLPPREYWEGFATVWVGDNAR